MCRLSQLLLSVLILLLVVTACAPGAAATKSPVQAEPTIVPTVIAPIATAVPATYETSLPAVLWGKDEQHRLFPLDPASGEALSGYEPIPFGRIFSYGFSPDRRTLAAVTFPNDYPYHDGSLLLVDLVTWRSREFDLKLDGWAGALVFSPDGGSLAISNGGQYKSSLTLFDLEKQDILSQGEIDLLSTRIKFTSAGNELMLYGVPVKDGDTENQMGGGEPQVRLLDAADLSTRWQAQVEGVREGIFPKDETSTLTPTEMMEQGQAVYLGPGIAFAPERDLLYIFHADSEKLTTVDFAAQTVGTVEIQARLTWLERLLSLTAGVAHAKVGDGTSKQVAVSPDGKYLYVVGIENESFQDQQGGWEFSQTPLGLEIIQTSDGRRVERIETSSSELSLSPDGRFLYLRSWMNNPEGTPETEVFDTSSRQMVERIVGLALFPALRMDGEPLLVSSYSLTENVHRMAVLHPDDLSTLAQWKGSDYLTWLTP